MNAAQIAAIQERINRSGFLSEPLAVDGFWGPKSIAGCQHYLRRLMPSPNHWPHPTESALQAFYGSPGDESKLVPITFPYPMFYDGKRVTQTRVHRRCADSLLRVLLRIGSLMPVVPDIADEASDYGGVYNNRPMRGGTRPSLHARGAAIDLDADDNGNRVAWPTAADMPFEIIEEFSKEGWTSAAAWWGRDAMHFQATQPL